MLHIFRAIILNETMEKVTELELSASQGSRTSWIALARKWQVSRDQVHSR